MVWMWIGILVTLLIVVIAFSIVCVHFEYAKNGHDDQLDIRIRALYGAFRYHYSVPIIKFDGLKKGITLEKEKSTNIPISDRKEHVNVESKDILSWYEKSKVLIHHARGFHKWLINILKRIHCTRMSWVTQVGVGDAPETAIITGMIWGVKASILGGFFNLVQLEARPHLAVVPQFNQLQFRTHLDCIVKLRLGYAMLAGLHLLVRIYKVKGGIRTWQNILSKA